MVTYKPIKKWLIPSVSIVIGLSIGFLLFPSKQEYHLERWNEYLDGYQGQSFMVETLYKRDDQLYSYSQGSWSAELAEYDISTPISDGSDFTFTVYFTDEKLYINSGDEWKFGVRPHRLLQEFIPLDNPFVWTKELLKNAAEISVEEQNTHLTFSARLNDIDDLEFRGVILQEQRNTILEMKVIDGDLSTIKLVAEPIRPNTVGPLVSYPDELVYELEFKGVKEGKAELPVESRGAMEIE